VPVTTAPGVMTVGCTTGVCVGLLVGVVEVAVRLGVRVGVDVAAACVAVLVGVDVATVDVAVRVGVAVPVAVRVGVRVGVAVAGPLVLVGECVGVGLNTGRVGDGVRGPTAGCMYANPLRTVLVISTPWRSTILAYV